MNTNDFMDLKWQEKEVKRLQSELSASRKREKELIDKLHHAMEIGSILRDMTCSHGMQTYSKRAFQIVDEWDSFTVALTSTEGTK